jgi:hypothetical protein
MQEAAAIRLNRIFPEMRCGWRALISFTSSVMMECFEKRGLKIQKFDEMSAPA